MIKTVPITIVLIIVVLFSSCLFSHKSPAPITAPGCEEPVNIYLREVNVTLPYSSPPSSEMYLVLNNETEASAAGITVGAGEIDFDKEMMVVINIGCYSGCAENEITIASIDRVCEKVKVNYDITNPYGSQIQLCHAYFCTSLAVAAKKTALPVEFVNLHVPDPPYERDPTIFVPVP